MLDVSVLQGLWWVLKIWKRKWLLPYRSHLSIVECKWVIVELVMKWDGAWSRFTQTQRGIGGHNWTSLSNISNQRTLSKKHDIYDECNGRIGRQKYLAKGGKWCHETEVSHGSTKQETGRVCEGWIVVIHPLRHLTLWCTFRSPGNLRQLLIF